MGKLLYSVLDGFIQIILGIGLAFVVVIALFGPLIYSNPIAIGIHLFLDFLVLCYFMGRN